MYERLKSNLNRKQNDINQIQRQRRIKQQLQPINQGIVYTQSKFYQNCEVYFSNIAKEAKNQQAIIQHNKKMKRIQKQKQKTTNIEEMLLTNILVDYFRSYQMNYSYSTIMREKNIISDEIILKRQLVKLLDLNHQYQHQQRLNVSVLQLIIKKIHKLQSILIQKKSISISNSVQCQLTSSFSQPNNILLTQIKLSEIRKQVQTRQKKHFQNQMHLFKSLELMKIKQDLSRLYQQKQKKITQKYQNKLKQIIKQKCQSIVPSKHMEKHQQYLSEISSLKSSILSLKQQLKSLQSQKLSHNCLKTPQIQSNLQSIQKQRKQLQLRKNQFQLAIRNMQTKVEDMCMQKQKIMITNSKQTDQFLLKNKQHKQNKEYMIDKIYSTLRNFEIRIHNLSEDNVKLLQDNQLLRLQVTNMKKVIQSKQQVDQTKKRLNISQMKCQMKNASLSVTPQEISSQLNPIVQVQQQPLTQSQISQSSQQFHQKMQLKKAQSQKINKLKYEMSMLKNKVKFMVMDSQ